MGHNNSEMKKLTPPEIVEQASIVETSKSTKTYEKCYSLFMNGQKRQKR